MSHVFAPLGLEAPAALVHSSFKGLGGLFDSPAAVVDALVLESDDRTRLFPTFSFSESHGPTHPPVMDVETTPSCVGAIADAARHASGAVRSLHPTHSVVAIGPDAEGWVEGHERSASPCDAASPFQKLVERGGQIVLLGGVTHDSNTTLHWLEEHCQVPYHLQPEVTTGVVRHGGRTVEVVNHLHLWGWDRDFERVEPILLAAGAQRNVPLGPTVTRVIDAATMAEVLIPRITADPLLLLSDEARRRFEALS